MQIAVADNFLILIAIIAKYNEMKIKISYYYHVTVFQLVFHVLCVPNFVLFVDVKLRVQ